MKNSVIRVKDGRVTTEADNGAHFTWGLSGKKLVKVSVVGEEITVPKKEKKEMAAQAAAILRGSSC